ncbi:MAG: voltage-gated sodium channel [Bradymonadia bacterium]|jgi:voltage-gated sodium channel
MEFLRRLAASAWFQNFVTAVIVFAAVLVGIETYPQIAHAHEGTLHWLNQLILTIFILEIVVKMGAEMPKPHRYFLDPWNVFDFVIVAACFIPGAGQYAVVLRLLRLLRVLKLLNAIPKLQILVGALLKSIPSMFYVSVLLFLLFYVYAVAAVFLFGVNDPYHFGDLQNSLLSLFRGVTLEDWTDLMYVQMYGCENYPTSDVFRPGAVPFYPDGLGLNAMPIVTEMWNGEMTEGWRTVCANPQANWWLGMTFFVSFVLLGTMVILNLFIGVIMNGMDEATAESELLLEEKRLKDRGETAPTIEHDIFELAKAINDLHDRVGVVKKKVEIRLKEQE